MTCPPSASVLTVTLTAMKDVQDTGYRTAAAMTTQPSIMLVSWTLNLMEPHTQ